MNFGGHVMAGWLIGNSGDLSCGERRAVVLMAIAPDIDGLTLFGPSSLHVWHRTFGHNVFWAAIALGIAVTFMRKGRRLKMLPFLLAGLASHFLLDLIVTGWWIMMPFWPVSKWDILMSNYIPENIMKYHIQIGLFILFLIPTIYIAWKRKRTPVEVLGKRADRFFLNFITLPFREKCSACNARAFYRCEKCGAPLCGRHRHFKGFLLIQCSTSDEKKHL